MSNVHDACPNLRVHSMADAIEFYERAFGATESFRLAELLGAR